MIETTLKVLEKAHKKQKSVCLIGDYGIGKSAIIYQYAQEKAQKLGKELVFWHELSEQQKFEIIKNVEKYFIVVDIKLQSVGDISKLTGIPIIVNGNGEHKVVWQPPLFVKALCQEKAYGILFLDEINMALTSFQSTAFEITLQRKIGEWKLSDGVLIVCAGNPLNVNISANPIPKPLINRLLFINFELPTTEEWLKWAITKKLDERVIAFVKLFEELHKDSEEELEQSTRPRSYELLSDMIKGEEDLEFIKTCAYGYLHKITASKFVKFIQLLSKLDYRKYLDNPELFRELNNEHKYALITLLVRHYKSIDKNKLVKLIKVISDDVLELSAILISLIKAQYGKKEIEKHIINKLDYDLTKRIIYLIV